VSSCNFLNFFYVAYNFLATLYACKRLSFNTVSAKHFVSCLNSIDSVFLLISTLR